MKSERRGAVRLAALLCSFVLLAGCGGGGSPGEDPSVLPWQGDVVGGGSELTIADSVPGDVIVAGGELAFSGVAGGDYLGAGSTLAIGGGT